MLYVRNSAAEPWVWKNTEVIQNYGNRANTLDLIPYLSQGTLDIFGKSTQVGIQLIDDPVFKTTLPAAGVSLSIKGALRVNVSQFDSKKNDVTEQFLNRMEMLELAVNGRLVDLPPNTLLGRNSSSTAGTVEIIPQTKFATPAMIDRAITDLAGGAPTALNTLIELSSALNNDANFGSNVINSLATKAPLANPAFTGNALINGLSIFAKATNHTNINPDGYLSGIASADANIDGSLRGWHFLTLLRGGNSDFGVQLALCDTSNLVKYRRKASGVWNSWINVAQ
jgi:hypothetical protein